jgi:hypothetical protein
MKWPWPIRGIILDLPDLTEHSYEKPQSGYRCPEIGTEDFLNVTETLTCSIIHVFCCFLTCHSSLHSLKSLPNVKELNQEDWQDM